MIEDDHPPQPLASTALRVVIAPDSFKGSADAGDVAAAIERGVRAAFATTSTPVEIDLLPLADGGEGTLDAIVAAWDAQLHFVDTVDAIGRPVTARYGISPDGRTAVIEAADANGLPAVSDVPLQPLAASSLGVGRVLRSVLARGVDEVRLFIGGSATTDGGAGLLTALGATLLRRDGTPVPLGGGALGDVARIDLSGLDPSARRVRWRIACDVTNPLVGPEGAAAVFGPQKGADPDDVAVLDAALARWADVLEAEAGTPLRALPGAGAAGGLAVPLVALLGGELEPGWRVVADAVGAASALARADAVITGEGRLDAQSLGGKVVSGVRELTPASVPVIVLAGEVALAPDAVRAARLIAFSIAPGPRSLDELRAETLDALERVASSVGSLLAAPSLHS
ncbi:glycerate kinase [Microbacterium sp. bgisy203]|uniref:glycerate kinase n=1 Tax=Microbacterium sp. bgisy203 TaxID=3413799 RepID=UPI003D70A26F